MQIVLEMPDDVARSLAGEADLSRKALEVIALDGLRSGKLSKYQVQRMLGFEIRYDLDGFLKQNGYEDPFTLEDLEKDFQVAHKFAREVRALNR